MHRHRLVATSLGVVLCLGGAGVASARRNGIVARGCEPCHADALASSIDIAADRMSIMPGEQVTFSVSIRRAGVAVGGLFIAEPAVGSLVALDGEGLRAETSGLTHTAP